MPADDNSYYLYFVDQFLPTLEKLIIKVLCHRRLPEGDITIFSADNDNVANQLLYVIQRVMDAFFGKNLQDWKKARDDLE